MNQPDQATMRTGLARRLAAAFYDLLIVVAIVILGTLVLLPFLKGRAVAPESWWFRGYLAFLALGFFVWFWSHGGQTLGAVAWRIRVVRRDGRPVRRRDALLRALAAVLSWAPAGLGFLWQLVDRERLTWHDRLSGTELVRTPPRRSS